MRELSQKEAEILFSEFPVELRLAYLDPHYVRADSLRRPKAAPKFLLFRKSNFVFYLPVHITPVERLNGYFDLESAYGHGGPIFYPNDPELVKEAWEEFSKWCFQNNILVEFLRFSPGVSTNGYLGDCVRVRSHIIVDLSVPDLLTSYSGRVRTAIKKAQQNQLKVIWEQPDEKSIREFMNLYYKTMTGLKASAFYYFDEKLFMAILENTGLFMATCFLDQKILGSSLFFISGKQMEYYLSASNETGKKFGASNIMLHTALEHGKSMGLDSAHLGGGTSGSPNDSLFFFKSGFSDVQLDFMIGKRIYNPNLYSELKKEFEISGMQLDQKIIFYR